jgi:hypothetical protein
MLRRYDSRGFDDAPLTGAVGQKEKVPVGIYYLVTNRVEASKAAQ